MRSINGAAFLGSYSAHRALGCFDDPFRAPLQSACVARLSFRVRHLFSTKVGLYLASPSLKVRDRDQVGGTMARKSVLPAFIASLFCTGLLYGQGHSGMLIERLRGSNVRSRPRSGAPG